MGILKSLAGLINRMLTPLAYERRIVLASLQRGIRTGRQLRKELADAGYHRSGTSFYEFMATLEDAGLVQGDWDVQGGRYTITEAGKREATMLATSG